jgi:hypothetical protein
MPQMHQNALWTCRSHRMQKHKINLTCPITIFVGFAQAYPSMKNSASMIHALDALECTM